MNWALITDEPEIVAKCRSYFEALWQRAGEDLERKQLDEWGDVVEDFRLSGGRANNMANLEDHGIAADYPDPSPVEIPIEFTGASQGFVKFLGSGKERVPLSSTTLSQLEGGACHWAACYPTAKRPRSVRDGAIIFMGRFISKPRDIRVFGRAIGMSYKEGRDDATPADIECRKWMRKWSRFIRVYHGEFVDGTLENGGHLKN